MGSSSIGFGAISAQVSALQSSQDRTIRQVQSATGSDKDAKIDKGSKEFEAMLLGTWLQQAEKSYATVPGGDADDEDAAGKDQMMSLGVQQLATSMAASGGIGIAKMVAHAMHLNADKAEAQSAGTKGVTGADMAGKKL
jgi:Rod binding domain-containing protein